MKKIPLSGTRGKGKFLIVDDDDYEVMSKYNWHLSKRGDYARCMVNAHKMVMSTKTNIIIDHINGDGLDNRKENLRVVTQAQNLYNRRPMKRNKTGYKGVNPGSHGKRFRAIIQRDIIGTFDTPEQAAKAYDIEAKKRFKEYARLNFPEDR